MSEAKENKEQAVSRRGALAALGVAAVGAMVAPQDAHADDNAPTRQDVGKVSFEIANYKHSSDQFERESNKSGVVDATSTDDTYPTAKSVYDFIKGKEAYQHEIGDKGKSLFVGTDGNTTLKTYTVDSELKGDSSNPVQGKVLYKAIKDLQDAVGLDEKPQKHESTGDAVTEDLKYICKSNGYVATYQEAQACPSNFSDCEMGVNYSYSGKGTITNNQQNWGVKRVDDAVMALCKDEFSGIFLGKRSDTSSWTAPQAIWHS